MCISANIFAIFIHIYANKSINDILKIDNIFNHHYFLLKVLDCLNEKVPSLSLSLLHFSVRYSAIPPLAE